MALHDYLADIPAEKQEAFKAELANVVSVKDRAEATELLKKNQHFKSAFDAEISYTAARIEKSYQEEKVPKLLEEALKKANTKDPATLEIEKLRAEIQAERNNALLEKRKAQAIAKAQELGLPADIMEFAVALDENQFNANIEKLSGLKTWGDGLVEKVTKERFGNQKPPVGGSSKEAPKMSLDKFNELPLAERNAFAKAGGVFE